MTITDKLTKAMIKQGIVKAEEEEIYRFGLDSMILKILYYSSYLLIAIFLQEVWNYLIFFSTFLMLRRSAGGFHAKTKTGCYLLSSVTVIGIILIMKFVPIDGCILQICSVFLFVADCFICYCAPLGNRNRDLDEEEHKYFKKKTTIVLAIENVVAMLFVFQQKSYAVPVILAIISEAIILLIEKRRIRI